MTVFVGIAANTGKNEYDQPIVNTSLAYARVVERAGGVPLILPLTMDQSGIVKMMARVDGLIIPGGMDIDPGRYGQKPHASTKPAASELDAFQLALVHLCAEQKTPLLGICRGAQVINVALGGTLIQDIPCLVPESTLRHMQKTLSFDTDHDVAFSPGSHLFELFGSSIRINSRHHQCIERPGKGLKVTAKAPDGVIEGAEHESLPIDLVQWHPELLMQKDDAMLPLFERFVHICRERQ